MKITVFQWGFTPAFLAAPFRLKGEIAMPFLACILLYRTNLMSRGILTGQQLEQYPRGIVVTFNSLSPEIGKSLESNREFWRVVASKSRLRALTFSVLVA